MAKYNIITDKLNNFFTNNKLTISSSKPSSGTWVKGDIVISNALTDGTFGWVCTVSGTPGTWMALKTADELIGDNNVTSHYHDSRYYQKSEVDTKLSGKSDTGHSHDDRYYTESETNNLLNGKSDTGHSHDDRYYTESETNNLLNGKSNTDHLHDSRYYQKSEVDTKLNGKSNNGHTHDDRYYTEGEINDKIGVQSGRKLHVQDWDPGSVGAGHIWIKTN